MSIGRSVRWFALGVQLLLAVSVAKQWLFVGTYRFYLDGRSEPTSSIAPRASQRFDIEGGRVEPQILATEDDRLSFPVAFPWRSSLEVRAVPVGRATVEIAVVERGHRLILSRRSLAEPADITLPLPPITGQLELVNEGALRWSDPRVVQQAAVNPRSGGAPGHGDSARPLDGKTPGRLRARGREAAQRLPGSVVRGRQRVDVSGRRSRSVFARWGIACPSGSPPIDGTSAKCASTDAGRTRRPTGHACGPGSIRSASGVTATSCASASCRPTSCGTLSTVSPSQPTRTASATGPGPRRPRWPRWATRSRTP